MVYIPTRLVDLYGKWRQLHHTWVLWEICLFELICLDCMSTPVYTLEGSTSRKWYGHRYLGVSKNRGT